MDRKQIDEGKMQVLTGVFTFRGLIIAKKCTTPVLIGPVIAILLCCPATLPGHDLDLEHLHSPRSNYKGQG